MRSRCLVILLCGALVLSGCKVSTDPTVEARYAPGKAADLHAVTYNGMYDLFALQKDQGPHREGAALATTRLSPGEPIGFEQTGDEVIAVAGRVTERIQSDRPHEWQMRADPDQVDKGKTLLLLAIVVGVTVGIIVATPGWGSGVGYPPV